MELIGILISEVLGSSNLSWGCSYHRADSPPCHRAPPVNISHSQYNENTMGYLNDRRNLICPSTERKSVIISRPFIITLKPTTIGDIENNALNIEVKWLDEEYLKQATRDRLLDLLETFLLKSIEAVNHKLQLDDYNSTLEVLSSTFHYHMSLSIEDARSTSLALDHCLRVARELSSDTTNTAIYEWRHK